MPDSREADNQQEASALLESFKAKNQAEQLRFTVATDSEYWFCLCFQTRAQKVAFLEAMGWMDIGDKYLDGTAVAERLGIDLPE